MSGYGWDAAKEGADKQAQSSGKFLRLADDKDKAVIAFLGEPYTREVLWDGAMNKGQGGNRPFTDADAEAGKSPRVLVSYNVLHRESQTVKIFEQGVVFYRELLRFKDKYGLDKRFFEVERHGVKKDQNTTYAIFPDDEFTAEETKAVKGLDLLVLDKELEDGGDDSTDTKSDAKSETKSANGAGGSISADAATNLVSRLKVLPKEKLTKFLERFDVKKIRDVKKADEEGALAFVGELEGKPEAASGEVDPFA